ncbi:MAG: DUF805 domain-containing protein [Celeribacter sp.]|jgi:uncharacterized membrane protein YhaH (DUF805 family)
MMSFTEAVKTCFEKYVVISGRAPRSELWWFALFTWGVSLLLGFIEGAVLMGITGGLISSLWSLAVLLPSICVGGRRLHDRDMSAWWLLLGVIPMIGQLALLVIFCLRGTEGPNRFGPDPLR